MSEYLLLPEHIEHVAAFRFRQFPALWPLASPVTLASAITGLYTAGVYFTPMFGGYVADRWLGRRRPLCRRPKDGRRPFPDGLRSRIPLRDPLSVLGFGIFKGNIASQVGELYGPNDLRRSTAFQTFFLGIQVAVIVAPVVTGFLGEKIAWHYGFGAAGVGMAVALVVYRWGRKYLPPERPRGAMAKSEPKEKLSARDWATMAVLTRCCRSWRRRRSPTKRFSMRICSGARATTTLCSSGRRCRCRGSCRSTRSSLRRRWAARSSSGPVYARHWREPNETVKLAIGALIAAGAPMLLAIASANAAATGGKVSLVWGLGFHVVNDVGFAMVFPVGLALFSRAAPRQVGGLFVGMLICTCSSATSPLARSRA